MRIPFVPVLVLVVGGGCGFRTVKAQEDLDAQSLVRDATFITDASPTGNPGSFDASTLDTRSLDVPIDRGVVSLDGGSTSSPDAGPSSLFDADPTYSPDAWLTCRWAAEPADPLPLTRGSPTYLLGLFGAGDGAWVLWDGLDDESGSTGVHLQRTSLRGVRQGAALPLRSLDGSRFSGAARAGLGALTGSEGDSACRFMRLSADGAPIGAPVVVAARRCFDLQPTPAGFSALTGQGICGEGGAVGHTRFDPTGGSVVEVELVPAAEHVGVSARVMRPDGGFVLVWASCDGRLSARRFAADGSSATARTDITALGPEGGRLVAAAVQDGVLVAWSRGDPSLSRSQVHVVSLDADGRPRTRPGPLDAPSSGRNTNPVLASSGGGAMLVWTDASRARDLGVAVRAMPLSSTGRPLGEVITLGEFGHDINPTYPAMFGSTDGILVAYLAQRDPQPAAMQVYTSFMRCLPP